MAAMIPAPADETLEEDRERLNRDRDHERIAPMLGVEVLFLAPPV